MARIDNHPATILLRLKQRLIDQLADATESNCWITLYPDRFPKIPPQSQFWYTISPGVSGRFDDMLFSGGGLNQTTTNWDLAIAINSVSQHDEAGRDEIFLTSDEAGLFPAAGKVLKVIAEHDLEDEEGNTILAQPLFPSDFSLNREYERRWGQILLAYKSIFDWELT